MFMLLFIFQIELNGATMHVYQFNIKQSNLLRNFLSELLKYQIQFIVSKFGFAARNEMREGGWGLWKDRNNVSLKVKDL